MPIPSTIETTFMKQYSPMLYVLAQQKGSKFISRCWNRPANGAKEAYYNRLGEDEAEDIVGRYPDTPNHEQPHTRRRVSITGFHTASRLDKLDDLQSMIDPQNEYTQNQKRALGRKADDKIIAAALGTAYAGEEGATAVTFAADSVSINGDGTVTSLGTAATAPGAGAVADISLAKVLLMMQIFNDLDVDEDMQKYWCCTPKDVGDLLDLEEVGSADYATFKAIQAGKMHEQWCGFSWFWSTRLTKDAATETAYRNIVWAKQGIIWASWSDLMTRVSELPSQSYTIQVYARMVGNAVRLDGDLVHECMTKVA